MKKSINKQFLSKLLIRAKKPLLVVGQGLRLGNAINEFRQVVEKLHLPVVVSRLGVDLLEFSNKYFIGHSGINGTKPAWLAIDNADLIIVVGCRLSYATVGYSPETWGTKAVIVMVDIDKKELIKPGVKIDHEINMDARLFFATMLKCNFTASAEWLKLCRQWKKDFPMVTTAIAKQKTINSYYFIDRLSKLASAQDIIIVDTGSCFHIAAQTWKIKKGQRFLTTGGLSSMGWWAAAMGAAVIGHTILITGDGSLQMNIQELATIKHYKMPIKMFVLSNEGYGLIRATQKRYFGINQLIGESPETGVWCPDLKKIAQFGHGIFYKAIRNPANIDAAIDTILSYKKGPAIAEVFVPKWESILKKDQSSDSLDWWG